VYDGAFWRRGSNVSVVVHENAHQWFGDSVSVASWRDIWLNEGFATYAQWLWSEAHGEGTAQELFDYTYALRPADDPFWQVKPGDPGAKDPFNRAVYDRGAMTLHQLRLTVADDAFFRILRDWASTRQYGNATIEEFEALAERTSGKDLHALFTSWLFTSGRPDLSPVSDVERAGTAPPAQPRSWMAIQDAHQMPHH
jgi:aminopeptidase N